MRFFDVFLTNFGVILDSFFVVVLLLLALFRKTEKVDKTSLWPMFRKGRAFEKLSCFSAKMLKKRVEKPC